jgi:hypothetical protein
MSSLTDFFARKGPTTLLTDTLPAAGAAAATPATGSQPDLTNRLLQIMSGQLGGTLTGGEKLSALGALLKSVSRGSQVSPQDVMRDIQKQKMAEVQGALQIQELRKAAVEKAQSDALKAEYVSQLGETNPQLARAIALMSPEKFADFVIQQNKPQGMGKWSEELRRFIPEDRPVPTRSGKLADGSSVTEYSNGDKVVTYRDGTQRRFDVEGNPVNG